MASGRPVALVTGASRGIGKATALDLAAGGFDVAVAARTAHDGRGRSDTDPGLALPGGLDTTLAQVEREGAEGFAVAMDLLDRPAVAGAVAAAVERFGRLDVLVNNAIYQGPGTLARFADLTDDELWALLEGNVVAQLALIRAALPHLVERGGTIVNLVSGAGHLQPPAKVGEGGWSLGYAMSKAAFGRVAPLLHVEYGELGVRVFSVDPGWTITERTVAAGRAAQYSRRFTPGTPDVIARAIRWLVADAEADALRGKVVMAQEEVRERELLARWPPPISQDRPWEERDG
ncbi:MAG TPA: SDR family oxidoreductase [Acidimicrobiales bacterium]|nr:SDR family oxidoreductase [Acidimicrobiales bacterium]